MPNIKTSQLLARRGRDLKRAMIPTEGIQMIRARTSWRKFHRYPKDSRRKNLTAMVAFVKREPFEDWKFAPYACYKDGKLHCDNGPAVLEPSGTRRWYKNGKRHRKGGPAIEYANGTKVWYMNDKRHRTDGPAVMRKDHIGTAEFWVKGRRLWKLK